MTAAMSEFVAHYVRQVFHEHARSATTDSSCELGLNFNPDDDGWLTTSKNMAISGTDGTEK